MPTCGDLVTSPTRQSARPSRPASKHLPVPAMLKLLPEHMPIRAILDDLGLDFEVVDAAEILDGRYPERWKRSSKLRARLLRLRREKFLQEVVVASGWSAHELARGLRDAGIVLKRIRGMRPTVWEPFESLAASVASKPASFWLPSHS